jgi:ribosomal protein S16
MRHIHLRKKSSSKQLTYDIIVTKTPNSVARGFIEKIGTYTPHTDKWSNKYIFINRERYAYWLVRGATVTKRLYVLIVESYIH